MSDNNKQEIIETKAETKVELKDTKENNTNEINATNLSTTEKKRKSSKRNIKNATKEPIKKETYLIIGHKVTNDSGWTFVYSESSTLREILINFVKMIDTSTHKRRTVVYADVISNLNTSNGIPISFALIEEMFGYKIDFISKVSNIFRDIDFTKNLVEKMNSTNEPLPF